MIKCCTTLTTSCRPALPDSHPAFIHSHRAQCIYMKRSCIGVTSSDLSSPAAPRSQAHPRSGCLSRAAHADGSAPKDVHQDRNESADVKAWDSMTDRLVGATSIPFSILVLPQAYTNYFNMAAGNGAALSILSWEVGPDGRETSALITSSGFITVTYSRVHRTQSPEARRPILQ